VRETSAETEVTAAYPSADAAEIAVQTLVDAGIPRTSIQVSEISADEASRYIWRLVVIIVLWSILGGVWGALIGGVLYATIGPEGTAGLVFQVVCWALIGHLLVGMIAGYWVLADRTEPEMAPDRNPWVVTVRASPSDVTRIQLLLRQVR
jgi:hypothetical protein